MAAEPHRLRRGRPPARTADPDGSSPARDFVPIESLTPLARKPIDVADATAADPTAADANAADPPAFVIDADPDWGERTSLFGDPEG